MSDFTTESQHQRWAKYGANVALAIVVALLLTIVLTYLAQMRDKRIDTTATGVYSLKPQTLGIIQGLKSPVKIVSLYSRQSKRDGIDTQTQAVEDLLNEYHHDGKNIEVEFIDPLNQPAKQDALIAEVTSKYGGEVAAYKAFLAEYAKQFDQLKQLVDTESKAIGDLPFDKVDDHDLAQALIVVQDTVQALPTYLDNRKDKLDRQLKQKPPDYKGAVDDVQSSMESLSGQFAAITEELTKDQAGKSTPDNVKAYITQSLPRYVAMKTIADGIDEKSKKLGDLKLDTLRQSLRERDSILVMGENDLRVLPYDKIWRVEDTPKQFVMDGKLKPTFAGEQLITTAIYGLSQSKKPKIVIVRPGGGPLAQPGIPGFQAGGPLSVIAEHLREYNFEVVEKDLSGQYAMQAQEQQMPTEPELSDDEIKDAIWLVIAAPMNQQQGPMGPMPSPIGPKLLEHLSFGGSAFVLPFPQDDSTNTLLKDWGIELRTDAVAVHETAPVQPGAAANDSDAELQRYPFVFNIRDYGDSPITNPLRSLDSLLVPLMPVKTTTVKGVKVTPLIPIPDAPKAPKSWGETDLNGLQNGEPPKFDPKVDVAGPLFGGAMAEKEGKGRVVVIAAPYFLFNQTLNDVDPDLARKGMFVPRYPGNLELFTDSMFWLAHQESMISISPSAMQVARIADMSDVTLNAWRIGVLLAGLPGLVIVAGVMMYLARRD